ncbi:hypothetical protein EUGRSUZ_B01887 [Eucalyptus grandis]|uniref:Uncharacterized protein n=2 Tax=Eucalyptus grandis TaxID=71139 RepID=A0ACC3LQK9_EUCGR|nr:hypothetical protein EUGRSUZ_B01887 [Eucalyptus grandis]
MSAWKDWSCYAGSQEEKESFSCLQHLVVRRCPELIGTLPRRLDHLIKLEIHSCLHLNDSTNEVHLPSLHELHIGDCNKEILKKLEDLTSLTILKIENLVELVCFDNGFTSYLVKLKELHIKSCEMLTYLWQDGDGTRNLTCLQSVVIEYCPQFTSFMRGQGEIGLPCDLERMELRGCTSLERLPSKLHTLRRLIIWSCPKIMGFTISPNDPSNKNTMSHLEYLQIGESLAEITVVESLESLTIDSCMNLGSLPQCLRTLVHLTHLEIRNCPAMEMEDLPPLPLTLSLLILYGCLKMKSIANCNIDSCNNLTSLYIRDCPALEMEDFPPLPITLVYLALHSCPKIKSLEWHRLTSLQELLIKDCENMECFPEGGFPPNLRLFEIWGCNNMKQPVPVREWGLPMLTFLKTLGMDARSMGGEGDKECFPSEEDDEDAWSLLFPSSLISLHIYGMRNVERLSSGLRHHLSSLQRLWIEDWPKLRDLPEDGLPPSLQQLWIFGCEILQERCSKHTGDYWPLIQEIPLIYIDGLPIQ